MKSNSSGFLKIIVYYEAPAYLKPTLFIIVQFLKTLRLYTIIFYEKNYQFVFSEIPDKNKTINVNVIHQRHLCDLFSKLLIPETISGYFFYNFILTRT